MTIRPYTVADRQGCIDAFKSNTPVFFTYSELSDFEDWLDSQEKPIASAAVSTNEQYYVIEQDGAVIGCGGYFIDPEKQDARMTWGLVTNTLHRRGVGKALFLYRLSVIRLVCPGCTIGLDTTQYSYPFFLKFGFLVTKITRNFYAEGIDRYDMELSIPSITAPRKVQE